MTEGNGIYHKNEQVNDYEYNFLNIPNKNMKAACGPGPRDCSLHEVWIHIFMRDVKKIV